MLKKLIEKLYTNKEAIAREELEERISTYIYRLKKLKTSVVEALNTYKNDYFILNGEEEKLFASKFFKNYKENGSWHYQTTYVFYIDEKGLKLLDKELKKYNLSWESE